MSHDFVCDEGLETHSPPGRHRKDDTPVAPDTNWIGLFSPFPFAPCRLRFLVADLPSPSPHAALPRPKQPCITSNTEVPIFVATRPRDDCTPVIYHYPILPEFSLINFPPFKSPCHYDHIVESGYFGTRLFNQLTDTLTSRQMGMKSGGLVELPIATST
jgi:hypothetical protein